MVATESAADKIKLNT